MIAYDITNWLQLSPFNACELDITHKYENLGIHACKHELDSSFPTALCRQPLVRLRFWDYLIHSPSGKCLYYGLGKRRWEIETSSVVIKKSAFIWLLDSMLLFKKTIITQTTVIAKHQHSSILFPWIFDVLYIFTIKCVKWTTCSTIVDRHRGRENQLLADLRDRRGDRRYLMLSTPISFEVYAYVLWVFRLHDRMSGSARHQNNLNYLKKGCWRRNDKVYSIFCNLRIYQFN